MTQKQNGSEHVEVKEDMRIKDTKYLRMKNDNWWFDFRIPKRLEKNFKTHRLRHSLGTSSYQDAIKYRDVYVVPLLRSQNIEDFLRQLKAVITVAEETKEEYAKNLQEFITKDKKNSILTVGILFDDFIHSIARRQSETEKKEGELSRGTVNKYKAGLKAFEAIAGREIKAQNIAKNDLVKFRETLLDLPSNWMNKPMINGVYDMSPANANEKKLSKKTVKCHLMIVKRAFREAVKDGKIYSDIKSFDEVTITVKKQKRGTTNKVKPTHEQVDELCSMQWPKVNSFGEIEWKYLPIFARYTGARISELATLNAENVKKEKGVLCLNITDYGKDRDLKTPQSERLIPVSDKLKPYLKELRKLRPKGRLFPDCGDYTDQTGNIRSANNYLKVYNRMAKKIEPNQSFHCLRVYANSEMTDAGIDIIDRERILGHDPGGDRTQAGYTDVNLNRYKDAVDTIY